MIVDDEVPGGGWSTSARLLREANRPWRLLFPLSVGGVLLALLLWLWLPFRGRH